MYESFNQKTSAVISSGIEFSKAYLCDMTENVLKELPVKNGRVKLEFKPFEIHTVKLV